MSLQPLSIGIRPLMLGGKTLVSGGGGTTPPVYATTFAVSLSASTGTVGTTQTATITPVNGSWPINQQIVLTTSGVACAFTPDNRTGSGTTPVTFGFTPSAAGALSVNATASGMTSTGAQNYTATSAPIVIIPTPSANASRFDIIPDQAVVAPGATAAGKVYPNSGNWSGGAVTLTRANASTINLTLPSSGNSPVSYSFTAGSAGAETLTPSNTAGLHNPAPAVISVFTSTSGAAATLSLGPLPTSYRAQRGFQQCVWSGAPNGFAGVNGVTLANGWARVRIPVASSGTALFARLTNADSSGATPTGGGTAISNIAQVFGAFASGANLPLLLPASDYCVYLDLATDSAFTNPVRMAIPFFIRDVALVVTRSCENMLFASYANGIPGNTNWSNYVKTTGVGSQNPGNSGFEVNAGNSWLRVDGVQNYGQYGATYGGVGAQELGRMFAAKKGTGISLLGLTPAGGDMDTFWAEDGTPCASAQALMGAVDGEARYLAFESNGWSAAYAPESYAEYRKVYAAIPSKMMSLYPSIAIVSGNAQSGQWGPDGSRSLGDTTVSPDPVGHGRKNQAVREVEISDVAVVAADANNDWNEYYSNSGHAAWSSAIRYARSRARSMLLAESPIAGGFGRGYVDRYTRLASTGTLSNGVITIPYLLASGATKIVAWRWANHLSSAAAWAYTTPSAADLRRLFAVYPGSNARYVSSSDTLIAITGVTIDTTAQVIKIAVPSNTTGPLTVQFMVDFYRQDAEDQSFWCALFDDRDLGDGCGYGPGVRSQLDIAVT